MLASSDFASSRSGISEGDLADSGEFGVFEGSAEVPVRAISAPAGDQERWTRLHSPQGQWLDTWADPGWVPPADGEPDDVPPPNVINRVNHGMEAHTQTQSHGYELTESLILEQLGYVPRGPEDPQRAQ